ncbi:hypothetical protein BWQ96_10394 [Gracilariopsis chorda]|uniref:Uncharacterized protein n=1 Tax=Gracilariopsis chorda TaxID=448386 RepID=A0A2V3ICY2_9FLOR|nr:hypothetical protein BWQ96_10394 [Gracilariopsis chorda]|eukprot:PXF39921.1 hypothetical protein BWQ96_10394 [Gracilariopsis chorda]
MYTFAEYRKDVLRRLEYLERKYHENANRAISVPSWLWGSKAPQETQVEGGLLYEEKGPSLPLKRKGSMMLKIPTSEEGGYGSYWDFSGTVKEEA